MKQVRFALADEGHDVELVEGVLLHGFNGRTAQEAIKRHDEFFQLKSGRRYGYVDDWASLKNKSKVVRGKRVKHDFWEELASNCGCTLVTYEA